MPDRKLIRFFVFSIIFLFSNNNINHRIRLWSYQGFRGRQRRRAFYFLGAGEHFNIVELGSKQNPFWFYGVGIWGKQFPELKTFVFQGAGSLVGVPACVKARSLPVNLHCWFCSCVTRMLTNPNQKTHSVTSFKIKVAYALKLDQRSTCSPRKKHAMQYCTWVRHSLCFCIDENNFLKSTTKCKFFHDSF